MSPSLWIFWLHKKDNPRIGTMQSWIWVSKNWDEGTSEDSQKRHFSHIPQHQMTVALLECGIRLVRLLVNARDLFIDPVVSPYYEMQTADWPVNFGSWRLPRK
jgi:hypothetical protein